VSEPPLEDLLTRLERERLRADRLYNDALTALDRVLPRQPALPQAPQPYDAVRVGDLNAGWDILPDGAPPADRSLKGRLRAFVWRLVGPPLEAQRQFNAALVDHVNRNAAAWQEAPRAIAAAADTLGRALQDHIRFESLLIQYLQTITAYVDTKDRSVGGAELRDRIAFGEQRLLALKRDLDCLAADRERGSAAGPGRQAAAPGPAPGPVSGTALDSVTYLDFEDRFRGSRGEIRRRVDEYVPLLAQASEVIDIGCGRGELLEALAARGVPARGVDANESMVDACLARGLRAERGDALAFLTRQTDGSLGAVVAIQVVEHFQPAYLARFLETALHKMQPAAPLVLETINPACWMAYFEAYLRDLTHVRALHPETLAHLVRATGFSTVGVQFRHPVGSEDRLEEVEALPGPSEAGLNVLAEVVNAHARKLNTRLFSDMDYVIVARK
jgi:SAM-dependent methyltransferase